MKRVKFGVSGHFLKNAWREWPEILHADVSWPPSVLISSGWRSVDFCNFGTILTLWNGSNLGFPGISWRTHGGNGLKFCTLMYLDHLQNWLVLGHGLLIFSSSMNGSVRPSVRLSVRHTFLTMFPSLYHHQIFRSYYQWQKWRPCKRSRSKVKVTEVTTQLNRFWTVTPVWIHIWWWNDAYSLIMLRRGALLFFKVIRQISRSHGSKNLIWPRLGVSGL